MFSKIKRLFRKKPSLVSCLLIFLCGLFVYLINDRTISSSDNIPNSLLALNLLVKHTIHLDAFRESYLYGPGGQCLYCRGNTPYYFIEAPNGHLTSTYPIGTAIISFPFYSAFFIYLKFVALIQSITSGSASDLFEITKHDFELYRKTFEKLAATIITALSAVLFYLAARVKFSNFVSITSTFIFAVATPTWVIISQGLRQHTASNFVVTAILLCLLEANRRDASKRKILLILAGVGCGLLPGIRVTSLLFAIATSLYVIYAFRKQSFFFILGLSSALINIAWNFYYFGFSLRNVLVGGYSNLFEGGAGSYRISSQYFIKAFSGLLASPSDGFLFYSPILLFAVPGIYQLFKHRGERDEQLLSCLFLACLALFLQYCVYIPWTGGSDSYGSRFMTDTLPAVCYLICYFLAGIERIWHRRKAQFVYPFIAFILCALFSIFVQAIGAFGESSWGTVPLPLLMAENRVWNLQDSEIVRSTKNLIYRVTNPIEDAETYIQNVDGRIEKITDEADRPFSTPISRIPKRRLILKADLINTGREKWYGYQTGMIFGETRIRGRFFDANGKPVPTARNNLLYVSGTPEPGSVAKAIGFVTFPRKPGSYKLVLDLIVQGVGEFPKNAARAPYTLDIDVKQLKDQPSPAVSQ